MREIIASQIAKYVLESGDNRLDCTGERIYDEPLLGFASADDPLFEQYKTVVGSGHLSPGEAFERAFGEGSYRGGTVVSVVLPVNEKIRESNRPQKEWPSKEWVLFRSVGDELFYQKILKQLEEILTGLGHQAVAPYAAEWFRTAGTPTGPVSNWSERHVAYAAGLGTFSLNDGFITERGIAVRLASVVTDLILPASGRRASNHLANCLFFSGGACGACIKRCPVAAITEVGHDRVKCWKYVYGEESKKLAVSYGGIAKAGSGCGLCQTGVPCECRNPVRRA